MSCRPGSWARSFRAPYDTCSCLYCTPASLSTLGRPREHNGLRMQVASIGFNP